MSKTLDQLMRTLPVKRLNALEQRAQVLIEQQLTLQALRKQLNLTQEALAALMQTNQANVSKVEKRSDMLISTLRGYIEAMGGSLELVARLPGREPVALDGFSDLNVDSPQR